MAINALETPTRTDDQHGTVVYVDMDAALLDAHQGQRAIDVTVQADVAQGLVRLAAVADQIVVLAFPDSDELRGRPSIESRIQTLKSSLDAAHDGLLIVTCPHHDPDSVCECAKPGSGLIDVAAGEKGVSPSAGWFIGADQEGVQSGRGAGLHTVRIGPLGSDHLSSVHRPDYEARDLLDAANHIMVEALR